MRKKKQTAFNEYLSYLTSEDAQHVNDFFINFKQHMLLPLSEERKMRIDLENALMYYNAVGVNVETALSRLDNQNLGGFYARPPSLYYALDDAAKIYPLSMKHGFMTVFRLSAILKDEVVPELLQIALTFTIKRFPRFATSLKKGFFWHYLDANKQRYAIEEDDSVPCRPMGVGKTSAKSFRVRYYKTRISVEFFHTLTDGRGGLVFLQTLVATYLRLTGVTIADHPTLLNINDTPNLAEDANEFHRSSSTKASGFKEKKALQMSGRINADRPYQILHFKLDSQKLKATAKSYDVTVTNYLSTLILLASKFATEATKGDISIQLPVDMRRYYSSQTLANFTMYAGIRLPLAEITTPSEIMARVKGQLADKTSYEKMSEMMFSAHKMARDVRAFPLFLKSPIAKIVYGFLGEKLFTTTFSNVGVVSAPPEFSEYVESFDFILGPHAINRATCTLVTYGAWSTLTITKNTKDPSFEEEMFRLLEKDGFTVTIEGSALYESKRRLSTKKLTA